MYKSNSRKRVEVAELVESARRKMRTARKLDRAGFACTAAKAREYAACNMLFARKIFNTISKTRTRR